MAAPEPPVREIRLGDEHESRGVTVQPVNDAGPALGPAGQRGAARDQGIDQSVVPVARSRVHHQTRRACR